MQILVDSSEDRSKGFIVLFQVPTFVSVAVALFILGSIGVATVTILEVVLAISAEES